MICSESDMPLYNWRLLEIIVFSILIFLDFLTLQLWRDGKEVEKHESPTKVFIFFIYFSLRAYALIDPPSPPPPSLLFPSHCPSSHLLIPSPSHLISLPAPPNFSSPFPFHHLIIFLLRSLSRSFYPHSVGVFLICFLYLNPSALSQPSFRFNVLVLASH